MNTIPTIVCKCGKTREYHGRRKPTRCHECARKTKNKNNRKHNNNQRISYFTGVKIKGKSDRKCKVCGEDPWPNYYFCPTCHSGVSEYEGWDVHDEHSVNC